MRDLKADLEELHSLMQSADSWENMQNFMRAFGDEWLNQALAEKERADNAEALVRELVEALEIAYDAMYLDIENAYDYPNCEQKVYRTLIKGREVLGDV